MLALLRQQPRPFFMIFMLEIWERFGFYTVQGILVLYFIRAIGIPTRDAYETFGTFSALIYVMIPVGGYLGDKLFGTKRTIIIGLVILALGYACLALLNAQLLYIALALICVGSALFKSNPSVLLAHCYIDRPQELHTGFTLYYMSINIGALASLLIGPYVSSHYGYAYAYILSVVGIVLGLLNYWLQRDLVRDIVTIADQRAMTMGRWALLVVGVILFVGLAAFLLHHTAIAKTSTLLLSAIFVIFYLFCIKKSDKKARSRMILALILMFEAIVFFTLYQQMPTSINVFAVSHVFPVLWGIHLDPQSFQVLNPFWIIIMSLPVTAVYAHLNRRNISFTVPYKFALGMFFCSIGFLVLFSTRFWHDDLGMISSWWLVGSYLFQSIGEILVSALGVAMVAELVPPQIMGFVMGMWFLTSSMAGFTGAAVASLTALPNSTQFGVESLMMYTHVFGEIGITTFVVACIMGLIAPFLARLMKDK